MSFKAIFERNEQLVSLYTEFLFNTSKKRLKSELEIKETTQEDKALLIDEIALLRRQNQIISRMEFGEVEAETGFTMLSYQSKIN